MEQESSDPFKELNNEEVDEVKSKYVEIEKIQFFSMKRMFVKKYSIL